MTDKQLYMFAVAESDWVIAYDLDDAVSVWEATLDDNFKKYGDDTIRLVPADEMVGFWSKPDGSISEVNEGVVVDRTAAEWCRRLPHGFFASTEY